MEHIAHIWPTLADLAADLGRPYQTVAAWKQRGRIPADYDLDLIDAARKRGKSLTLEQLAIARRGSAQGSVDHPPAHVPKGRADQGDAARTRPTRGESATGEGAA